MRGRKKSTGHVRVRVHACVRARARKGKEFNMPATYAPPFHSDVVFELPLTLDLSCNISWYTVFIGAGDPSSDLTLELDIELNHPGPHGKGLFSRSKRTAMYIVNGVIKAIRIAEAPDDPAGDDHPDVTLADAMLKVIADVNAGHASEL